MNFHQLFFLLSSIQAAFLYCIEPCKKKNMQIPQTISRVGRFFPKTLDFLNKKSD